MQNVYNKIIVTEREKIKINTVLTKFEKSSSICLKNRKFDNSFQFFL